jgi:hypothetical protein
MKEREHNILKGVINGFGFYLIICGSFNSAISSLILPGDYWQNYYRPGS